MDKETQNFNKMSELYETATARFMDKMDIDVTEYMTTEERGEYKKLYLWHYGECPFCGCADDVEDCKTNCK
jgi:hypothetical protein